MAKRKGTGTTADTLAEAMAVASELAEVLAEADTDTMAEAMANVADVLTIDAAETGPSDSVALDSPSGPEIVPASDAEMVAHMDGTSAESQIEPTTPGTFGRAFNVPDSAGRVVTLAAPKFVPDELVADFQIAVTEGVRIGLVEGHTLRTAIETQADLVAPFVLAVWRATGIVPLNADGSKTTAWKAAEQNGEYRAAIDALVSASGVAKRTLTDRVAKLRADLPADDVWSLADGKYSRPARLTKAEQEAKALEAATEAAKELGAKAEILADEKVRTLLGLQVTSPMAYALEVLARLANNAKSLEYVAGIVADDDADTVAIKVAAAKRDWQAMKAAVFQVGEVFPVETVKNLDTD